MSLSDPVRDAKVAVVGGRGFTDVVFLCRYLDAYYAKHGVSILVTGGAPGADQIAEEWARRHEIDTHIFRAHWSEEGKRAGPRRNLRIAEYSDVMLAFPSPESVGTWNAVSLMRRLNKPVWVFQKTADIDKQEF